MEFNIKKNKCVYLEISTFHAKARIYKFINYRRPSNYGRSSENADPDKELKALQVPKLTANVTLRPPTLNLSAVTINSLHE